MVLRKRFFCGLLGVSNSCNQRRLELFPFSGGLVLMRYGKLFCLLSILKFCFAVYSFVTRARAG